MARKNYSDEFRRQAVDLYESTPGATLSGIADDLGISRGTLADWVKTFGTGSTTAPVFGGFEPPVTPDGSVTAGRTIPVKWTVTGANVSDTTIVSGAFTDGGATYAMVRNGGTWHVNAATPKEWAGNTWTFRVVLDDLSVHEFDLGFR